MRHNKNSKLERIVNYLNPKYLLFAGLMGLASVSSVYSQDKVDGHFYLNPLDYIEVLVSTSRIVLLLRYRYSNLYQSNIHHNEISLMKS